MFLDYYFTFHLFLHLFLPSNSPQPKIAKVVHVLTKKEKNLKNNNNNNESFH